MMRMKVGKGARKSTNEDCLFKIFGILSGESSNVVQQHMLSSISGELNWFSNCAWIVLHMNKYKFLSQWMTTMYNPTIPGDEIALYTLSCLYKRQSLM